MSLTRLISRAISRHVAKKVNHKIVYHNLQKEASARPESTLVETPAGKFWMSPIELRLYEAMRNEGLSPTPQFCIEDYFVDFAFPDIKLAVEADGIQYHSGENRQRDRRRDWVLNRAGWTVKRFYGTTIHNKASNCAYVIKKEIETRLTQGRDR